MDFGLWLHSNDRCRQKPSAEEGSLKFVTRTTGPSTGNDSSFRATTKCMNQRSKKERNVERHAVYVANLTGMDCQTPGPVHPAQSTLPSPPSLGWSRSRIQFHSGLVVLLFIGRRFQDRVERGMVSAQGVTTIHPQLRMGIGSGGGSCSKSSGSGGSSRSGHDGQEQRIVWQSQPGVASTSIQSQGLVFNLLDARR